ncbi:hypothetical protein ACFFTN_18560 [Aminobacter aganoensis]|uniref:Uncharacterized protein n=1 Tax=Aminobacter aganoensis TaxID=83264 RepID=A0A7X0KIN9_9HYPH|nr:hypothetical protein [Aminobacter aganoensis]MBB6352754.1 hypothetical protein [Aminobacter aganoensis]
MMIAPKSSADKPATHADNAFPGRRIPESFRRDANFEALVDLQSGRLECNHVRAQRSYSAAGGSIEAVAANPAYGASAPLRAHRLFAAAWPLNPPRHLPD